MNILKNSFLLMCMGLAVCLPMPAQAFFFKRLREKISNILPRFSRLPEKTETFSTTKSAYSLFDRTEQGGRQFTKTTWSYSVTKRVVGTRVGGEPEEQLKEKASGNNSTQLMVQERPAQYVDVPCTVLDDKQTNYKSPGFFARLRALFMKNKK